MDDMYGTDLQLTRFSSSGKFRRGWGMGFGGVLVCLNTCAYMSRRKKRNMYVSVFEVLGVELV